MSTIRTPVGPQPPAVYWKRRAIVLLGLVAVIVIILLIVFRPQGGTPTPAKTTSAPPSTSSETSTDPAACAPEVVQLAAITDKDGYNTGENPMLSMTITNIGASACTINAGTDAQEYIIESGTEQYWSSRDCQADPEAIEVTLEPNVPKSTNPFAWDRTRSSVDTCTATRPAVPGGGASYHLTVKLGDLESDDSKQFLLY